MMLEYFETVIDALLRSAHSETALHLPEETTDQDDVHIARSLNAAFLLSLAGESRPLQHSAGDYLSSMLGSHDWNEAAAFYLRGVRLVRQEIQAVSAIEPGFAQNLRSLSEWLMSTQDLSLTQKSAERFWSVFFPEAVGIISEEDSRIQALRDKRTVTLSELNPTPVEDPARQVLFTANVLLTLPPSSQPLDELALPDGLKDELKRISREPQRYWYDHPIQIGVAPDRNEAIYGIRGLSQTLEFEKAHRNAPADARLTCVLSVSVTHSGLHAIAKEYLQSEFVRTAGLTGVDVYAFTESDTMNLVEQVLVPAARHYLGYVDAGQVLDMFGVDGEYGRHYTFLKAIAAFWSVFIDEDTKATFKIDLDQVFPQQELVETTGASAFEHLMTPRWGAHGTDRDGHPLELGMLAGALVNESDIDRGLFTPDVPFPDRPLEPHELVFFSQLPQALSTQAEMMTRYSGSELDGETRCIQRYHVTGGTNGILIDSLIHYRPFTPSFIGRAEDQAYLLSAFQTQDQRLAYVHQPGLIMRHDKHAFAQEAIQAASTGKLVGDYARLLLFSAYARLLTDDISTIKDQLDPFTGCFISHIPHTVAHLRFALQAASFFEKGYAQQGVDFIKIGAQRIPQTLAFIGEGQVGAIYSALQNERRGWDLYYDILSAIKDALARGDDFACHLQETAQNLVQELSIKS